MNFRIARDWWQSVDPCARLAVPGLPVLACGARWGELDFSSRQKVLMYVAGCDD